MPKRTLLLAIALLLLIAGCAKHEFEAEWLAWHEDCVNEGVSERAAIGNADQEGIELVEDTCDEVVNEMSGRYQDVPPDEIPESEMDEVFESIFKDCLNKDFLESEYC